MEPIGFSEDDSGQIVVEVHQVVRDLEGKVLVRQTVRHVYLVQDGLVARMRIVG